MKFRWNWREVAADQGSAHRFTQSFYHSLVSHRLWVKLWHRNKTACSKSNPMQSSRSESTTCQRKVRLLRFESNSAATSDGVEQKLGSDVRCDSESITTKVCSQIGCKWNAMFESHVVTSVDRTSFDFRFSIFFEQSSFVNIHLLCYWPTIHNSI